ncbi:MAG TPA: PfaD family polyunsaturated fatty acid/polyketide biosynthesis protein [Anaerolineae bacterium]|nr:PfaD family polyunsaturated fatty acid/polyketide biosynthesis protein [Anaerolineae bacterium]HQK14405.1 PfaD family polyunsaturated fatty acid/polyketide biosynthesis protein [Anaerolineae bacterium]
MQNYTWTGPAESVAYDEEGMAARVHTLDAPCYAIRTARGIGLTNEGGVQMEGNGADVLAIVPPVRAQHLGDAGFRTAHGLQYAYMAGSMANAISSVEMVIALGKAGMLGSFGAGGVLPERLEAAILRIQEALPHGPYAFNLIHSPNEPALERRAMELYLHYGVRVIEASAYLTLTPYVVQYRAAGLEVGPDGNVIIHNRIIAKVSRREVATQFMQPAPAKLLTQLREQGLISATQARLAERVPMADDVTVEADSGGHTDNRPLVCLMPSMLALRDEIQAQYHYPTPVRIGAAGGIGTPAAVLGALMMGAAYVLTGSINHSCVEAGTSPHVKHLLAQAGMADVMMAPAADMFEMGVNVQVLKRGTMFPLRARKLYEIYQAYDSIEAIPAAERQKLEQQIFKRNLDDVWADCITFFNQRDPTQIEKAQQNPKRKMALIFRWYLGLATRWGIVGEPGREVDYQIWCGPAMGAFNDWTRGTPLEQPENRHVADVGRRLMEGAALLYRMQSLKMQGVTIPTAR